MKAMFEAEAIGWGPSHRAHEWPSGTEHLPWLARITGLSARWGLEREFLQAKLDYSRANSRGTRGVYYCWPLASGEIYETAYKAAWNRVEREFLKVTDDGRVEKITRQEVDAWLAKRLNVSRIEPA